MKYHIQISIHPIETIQSEEVINEDIKCMCAISQGYGLSKDEAINSLWELADQLQGSEQALRSGWLTD